MSPTIISENRYVEATENNEGFCVNCQDFTHDSSEPDARNYECDECGRKTVFGAEESLIQGYITVQ